MPGLTEFARQELVYTSRDLLIEIVQPLWYKSQLFYIEFASLSHYRPGLIFSMNSSVCIFAHRKYETRVNPKQEYSFCKILLHIA